MAKKKQQISSEVQESVPKRDTPFFEDIQHGAPPFIVPLTKAAGDKKHLLQELVDKEEAPTWKAVGYAQLAPGSGWVSYLITFQGDKVLKIQVGEPDMRQIAEESAKSDFVTEFMDKGL